MPGIGISDRQKKFEGFDFFVVESAAETLTRAEVIKTDKKLWNAASKFIAQRMIAERQAKLDAAKKAAKV